MLTSAAPIGGVSRCRRFFPFGCHPEVFQPRCKATSVAHLMVCFPQGQTNVESRAKYTIIRSRRHLLLAGDRRELVIPFITSNAAISAWILRESAYYKIENVSPFDGPSSPHISRPRPCVPCVTQRPVVRTAARDAEASRQLCLSQGVGGQSAPVHHVASFPGHDSRTGDHHAP